MKQVFSKLKIDCNLTFEAIYNKKISQTVLLYYWEEIADRARIYAFGKNKEPMELFEVFLKENPHLKKPKAMRLFTAMFLIQQSGARRLRNTLGYTGKKSRKWYDMIKDIKGLVTPKNDVFQSIYEVDKVLRDFDSVKPNDFADIKDLSFENQPERRKFYYEY